MCFLMRLHCPVGGVTHALHYTIILISFIISITFIILLLQKEERARESTKTLEKEGKSAHQLLFNTKLIIPLFLSKFMFWSRLLLSAYVGNYFDALLFILLLLFCFYFERGIEINR